MFQPTAIKGSRYCLGYCRHRPIGRAYERTDRPHCALMPLFFLDHFQTWQRHWLPYGSGRLGLWRFCLIRYTHDWPFNDAIIISVFTSVIFAKFLRIFQHPTMKIAVRAPTSIIFLGSFSHVAKVFITLRSISDELDCGGSASLNMRMMDHFMV